MGLLLADAASHLQSGSVPDQLPECLQAVILECVSESGVSPSVTHTHIVPVGMHGHEVPYELEK